MADGTQVAIIVHGGAWAIPDELVERSLVGVKKAAIVGWKQLCGSNGNALDAVERAVTVLEDDTAFDAGTGSVLTYDGTVEMDAIIMDGRNLRLGSVACVTGVKNPVKLARLVMDQTEHTMLVGSGANAFAQEKGVPVVPTSDLVTPEAKEELERFKTYNRSVSANFSERKGYHEHETVGCVAYDASGNLAAATSTGGITGKRPGRVGDSPLVGSGAYADIEAGAASTTGHGESISKVCLARRIVEACEKGNSSTEAARLGLDFMRKRVGQAGGAICIDKKGQPGLAFNSERMAWALITNTRAVCGINPSEIVPFVVE